MILFIMTRGRVGRQHTLKWIPESWLSRTFLVCPEAEIEHHGHQCLIQPPHVTNYSQKFQWLLDYPDEKVVIMDDDLFFSKNLANGKLSTYKERSEELSGLWEQMEALLDETALVGVPPRQMGHLAKLPFVVNSKVICIQGVNTELVKRAFGGKMPKVDFFPIMSDQIFAMTLLKNGIGNKLITTFCQDHGPSQAPGGCDYRTIAMQEEAVRYIGEHFGPFARVVTKKPKTAKWLGDTRLDLTVQWKQMHMDGSMRKHSPVYRVWTPPAPVVS